MMAKAFCPAHITGFFKAFVNYEDKKNPEQLGSMGAGFSIKEGVTTSVKILPKMDQKNFFRILITGYQSDNTVVSEFVLKEFLKMGKFDNLFFDITHRITIPVGYGLGSSSAIALSLSFALNEVLQTKLTRKSIGLIAHIAEINCKTGLGDVLASYHGGFEIRVKPGAPGIGKVDKILTDNISIITICFSPIPTNKFIKERLPQINGLGGKMVKRLLNSRDFQHFQDMSLEFAKYINILTPKMENVIQELKKNGIKSGVALFGETVFTMIPKEDEDKVLKILKNFPEGIIIKSELDNFGARLLN